MTDTPAGDTHSRDVLRSVDLHDGNRLVVRTADDADADGLLGLFDRLPSDDRYRRFFSAFHPDRPFVEHMIALSERGGALLVAEVRGPDEARIVGEAGYSLLDDGDAALDITVDRTWRGWLGPYLLDALVEAARDHGIANLRAEILVGNRPMLALVRARGYATVDSDDRSVIETTMGTGSPTPCWPPHRSRPRVLVEVPGARWRVTPELRDAGVDVIACPGPKSHGGSTCPLLNGERCPLIDGADVVVYSLRHTDDHADELLAAHRAQGTRPLVIEARRGEQFDDLPPGATRLDTPTAAEVRALIEELLGSAPEPSELVTPTDG